MILPAVLDMSETTANNNYIVGPLAITFSVISLWEINRNALKLNMLLGIWLLLSLAILDYNSRTAFLLNGICGVLLILLSLVKRKKQQNFGGGWRSLFQHNPPHLREAERKEIND